MKKLLLSTFCVCSLLMGFSQLTVDNTQSPASIVEDVFLANGIFVSNVTFNGGDATVSSEQIGSFDGSNTNLGLNAGIVMATGDVNVAVGPNNQASATLGGNVFGGTDPDLAMLVADNTFNDWAILEFDFIATGDSMSFQYVFGSEEYQEFVGTSFNDHFAFFVSGPGISGPYSNGATNIALIPGTLSNVSINSVNQFDNSEYFIENGDGGSEPFLSDNAYVQFDGLTVPLMACLGQLQVGETYHIKLALADVGDSALDSGVFLAGDSFVQFCSSTVDLQAEDSRGGSCMLSEVRAHVDYTEVCGVVQFVNTSYVNLAYTSVEYEINGTETFDAEGTVTHTFDEAGVYEVKLVYGYNGFRAKYTLEPITISMSSPEVPTFQSNGSALALTNYDGTSMIQWYLNGNAIDAANAPELEAIENGLYSVVVNNGCPATSVGQMISVGIAQTNSNLLHVYPNPSEGLFNIEYPGMNLQCTVHNSLGQIVFAEKFTSRTQLNITQPGVYSITVSNAENSVLSTQKVIVK
jgi:hypothetical protein